MVEAAAPRRSGQRAIPRLPFTRSVKGKPKTIDEYLATISDDQRAALEELREAIRAAAPKAEECISYGLAAFRLDGKALVAFGAAAKHRAFYLMSDATVDARQLFTITAPIELRRLLQGGRDA